MNETSRERLLAEAAISRRRVQKVRDRIRAAQQRLRRGRSVRAAHGGRRRTRRDGGPARAPVRRPRGPAARSDARRHRSAARTRLHLQHRKVPADAAGPQRAAQSRPGAQEMENCRPFLGGTDRRSLRPKVILALGSPAAKWFLGNDFQITRMRGRWYVGPRDTPLMVTFHPAYILRQTGGQIDGVKRLVWDDLEGRARETRRTACGRRRDGGDRARDALRVSRDPQAIWLRDVVARAGFAGVGRVRAPLRAEAVSPRAVLPSGDERAGRERRRRDDAAQGAARCARRGRRGVLGARAGGAARIRRTARRRRPCFACTTAKRSRRC